MILQNYLIYILSSYVQNQIINKTYAVGVPKLALERIKTIKIPLCSIDKQNELQKAINEDNKTIEANETLIAKYEDNIRNKIDAIWTI